MNYTQQISAIIKDVFLKACVCFTVLVILLNMTAVWLRDTVAGASLDLEGFFTPSMCFMFAFVSFLAGISAQVFKITKIPAFSRHIAFFILLYATFFIVVIPLSNHSANQGTTLLLSVTFILVYLVAFGIFIGIKSALGAVRNSKLKYDEVYKSAE